MYPRLYETGVPPLAGCRSFTARRSALHAAREVIELSQDQAEISRDLGATLPPDTGKGGASIAAAQKLTATLPASPPASLGSGEAVGVTSRCQVAVVDFDPTIAAAATIQPPPIDLLLDGMPLALRRCAREDGGGGERPAEGATWRWRRKQSRQLQLALNCLDSTTPDGR